MPRRPPTQPLRATRLLSGLAGLCVSGVLCLAATTADARDGLALKTPRLQPAPLSLRLQPESARLVLDLPSELLPARDLGMLGRPLDPNKYWDFGTPTQAVQARLGAGLGLRVDDRRRGLQFQFSLLPRAAVAELRFDPIRSHRR